MLFPAITPLPYRSRLFRWSWNAVEAMLAARTGAVKVLVVLLPNAGSVRTKAIGPPGGQSGQR